MLVLKVSTRKIFVRILFKREIGPYIKCIQLEFFVEGKFKLFFCVFLAREGVFMFFGGKFLKNTCLNVCSKLLSGEPLCKFVQIFPPKDLVYIGRIFLGTFLMI